MFLASVLQEIVGGGVRTQVAGFEVQVLIDVSWVDLAKWQAAGFEPRSQGSKSKGFGPRPRGLKSDCLSVFLRSILQMAGDWARTHVAWFEIQV